MYIIPNETKQCGVIFCLAETDECAFNHSPQLAPGNLVRLDGYPALTGLDMIQMPPGDAIGSDDFPINYVATLAAFLARLRPHKSELSQNKTRLEPRESNFWATSSLKMVSVLTRTKSPPCLACLCLPT